MQSCTCFNWVHLKCSLLSSSRFRTLGSSHSWSRPCCCAPSFFAIATPTSTVPSSSDSCSWYTSTPNLAPSLLMQHLHPTLAFKPLILFRPLCIFSLCTLTTASCSWLFLFTFCFLFPSLTPSGFFNGMLGVSEPGALNCYTLFRLIPLTLLVSRNLTLIYLPLSGFLDFLLCNAIAPTPDPVFFLLMSQTLAAASSFSLGRAYPSLNFLPPLFLCLTPTDYVKVNISLNTSYSLSFLNVYAPSCCSSPKNIRTNFFSPSILPSYVKAVEFSRFRVCFHRKRTASSFRFHRKRTASSFRFHIPDYNPLREFFSIFRKY